MHTLRLFDELQSSQRILLVGAGGGFDIFCGLPLYFALRALGKEVHLANVSFSALHKADGEWVAPSILEVTESSQGSTEYFPEKYLCEWFASVGDPQVIYCIERTGYQAMLTSYKQLLQRLHVDAIVLVDGGTDSLMRGDEPDLGTPEEDLVSIACIDALDVPTKALVALGFGIDTYHGVCHAYCLEAVAEISKRGGYWGTFSIHQEMEAVQRYSEATHFVFKKMPRNPSIVNASILSALEGEYGDVHKTHRTHGSRLWINPLMSMYWCFELRTVAQRILYLDAIRKTKSYSDVQLAIATFRGSLPKTKDWRSMPI